MKNRDLNDHKRLINIDIKKAHQRLMGEWNDHV